MTAELRSDLDDRRTAEAAAETSAPRLVYVDLDGTLIRSDILFEALALMVRKAPLRLFVLFAWLLKGRAYLKAKLTEEFTPDVSTLPYRDALVDYLRAEKTQGRSLILATASNAIAARAVADHLGLFDHVLASSSTENLKGHRKAHRILEHAAGSRFTYVGDSAADLAVWEHAGGAVLVGNCDSLRSRVARKTAIEAEHSERPRVVSYFRAIRVHQWLKNLLVFVPLVAAHKWDSGSIGAGLAAFVSFCACASAIYLVNDIADLGSDRRHPRKKARPLASGAVPLAHAMLMVPPLLAVGLLTGAALGPVFLTAVIAYLATTVAYSMYFKEYVLIDVFLLASLYTVRVVAGALAIAVWPSFWLLAFSMFLFFSLALVKRCSELLAMQQAGKSATHGRDYRTADYSVLQALGTASGIAAVVVFALYVDSPAVVEAYAEPRALWLVCGTLAYWISRMWLKTARGEMHDDPLVYAARDRASAVMALCSMASFAAAVWG